MKHRLAYKNYSTHLLKLKETLKYKKIFIWETLSQKKEIYISKQHCYHCKRFNVTKTQIMENSSKNNCLSQFLSPAQQIRRRKLLQVNPMNFFSWVLNTIWNLFSGKLKKCHILISLIPFFKYRHFWHDWNIAIRKEMTAWVT